MKNDFIPLVAHLIPRYRRGGVESSILIEIGGQVKYNMVFSGGGEGINYLEKEGISWEKIYFFPSNPFNIFISFFQLYRAIRKYKIELIHSHHRFTSLVGNMVARSLKIPFVCSVHDLASGHRLFSRFAFGNIIIVYSQAVKSHLIEHFGVNSVKIHLVTMGMLPIVGPTKEQYVNLRLQAGCSLDTQIVCFSGRIVQEKGIDIFLQAISHVLERLPNTKFWIIGDGELRLDMESLAAKLGITRAVTFWGWRDDATVLMGCVDLVVVPSRREGFGKTALEALMLGKPVIATNVGGLPELVKHEKNGLLVPTEEPNLIAESIVRLLVKKDEMLQTGTTASESVTGKYSIESMREEIKKIYCFAMEQQVSVTS